MTHQLALMTVSGHDHPGITAQLMGHFDQYNCQIEDMGQTITHGFLSLSILFSSPNEIEKSGLVKDLLFSAKELNVNLDYKVVDNKRMIQEKSLGQNYILSCVGPNGIPAIFLKEITKNLAKLNINIQKIENIQPDTFNCLEIAVVAKQDDVNWNEVKKDLITLSNQYSIDLALIKDDVWRRNKRLIVFDMDSTLIQSEVIVEMAKVHGVGKKVHDITEEAMNGKLDFNQSLTKRVALLEGLEVSKLEGIRDQIKLTEGVQEFVKTLKNLGYKLAIISGGFQYFANHFKDQLGFDYAFANDLHIDEGKISGKIKGPIVNAEKKAMLLELISQQENIKLEQVVAIGDGANDLEMLSKAGLGIAFHAKDIVKENAQQHMSHGTMSSILYFLGLPGTGA